MNVKVSMIIHTTSSYLIKLLYTDIYFFAIGLGVSTTQPQKFYSNNPVGNVHINTRSLLEPSLLLDQPGRSSPLWDRRKRKSILTLWVFNMFYKNIFPKPKAIGLI